MTIDEFLSARLDELETLARRAIESGFDQWGTSGFEIRYVSPGSLRGDGLGASVAMTVTSKPAAHIAYHDPAYVLADVAAKRKILRDFIELRDDPTRLNDAAGHMCFHVMLRVVVTLTQPFAEHPDFSPEWKTP